MKTIALFSLFISMNAFAQMKVDVKYDQKTYKAIVSETSKGEDKNELLKFYNDLKLPEVLSKNVPSKFFRSYKRDFSLRCQQFVQNKISSNHVECEFNLIRKKSPEYEVIFGHKFSAIVLYQRLANRVFVASVKESSEYLFESDYGFQARFNPLAISLNFEQE